MSTVNAWVNLLDSSDEEGNVPLPFVKAADSLRLGTSPNWDSDSSMGLASDEDDEDRPWPDRDVESTISLGLTILKEDSDDSSLDSVLSASASFSSIVGDDFNASPPYNPSSPVLLKIVRNRVFNR